MYNNIENSKTEDFFLCRICHEYDSLDNLIHPCKCSGTSKYIHKHCLHQWMNLSSNPLAKSQCFECKYNYIFKVNPIIEKECCISKISRFVLENIYNFFCINLIIIIIFAYLLYFVNISLNLFNLKYYDIYLIYASYIYQFLLILIILFNFTFIKNKILYIKYFCKNPIKIFITSIIYIILFIYTYFFGIVFMIFLLQYLTKIHLTILNKINHQYVEVENYVI